MTNTKFRKRALLSSVAMLLVALVALGSATFAWFVDDPNVTASGIRGRANTALGLVAQTTTDGWGTSTWVHNPQLARNLSDSVFVPATTANGTSYFTAAAASYTDSAIDTASGKLFKTASVGNYGEAVNGGVYSEQIKFKLEGGTTEATLKLTGCTVTGTSDAKSAAVTVAVVYNNTLLAEFNKGNADGTINKWAAAALGNNVQATNYTTTGTLHKSGTLGTPITVASFTADEANSGANAVTEIVVDVYVYLDGANAEVKSSQANADSLLSGVALNFTAE